MIKKVKKPGCYEFQGESVGVNVIFDRYPDGREFVTVVLTTHALPDERQVKINVKKYDDGAVIKAEQNQKLPKKRPEDPMPEGYEIKGELMGKVVILKQKLFAGDIVNRVVQCTGGFGCNADGLGRKVFGVRVATKEEICIRREHASRFAMLEEILEAKARGNQVAE